MVVLVNHSRITPYNELNLLTNPTVVDGDVKFVEQRKDKQRHLLGRES